MERIKIIVACVERINVDSLGRWPGRALRYGTGALETTLLNPKRAGVKEGKISPKTRRKELRSFIKKC
jgi:hypothetical protein